jgi:hypothetical protein
MTRLRASRAGGPCPRRRGAGRAALFGVALTAALVIGSGADLVACPACFAAEETSLIDGARLGILVMLGLTFTVQGAFLGFFLYLRRRARRMAESDLDIEWAELQRGSRTS